MLILTKLQLIIYCQSNSATNCLYYIKRKIQRSYLQLNNYKVKIMLC